VQSNQRSNELPFLAQVVRADFQVLEAFDWELSAVVARMSSRGPKPTSEFVFGDESGDPLLCWWHGMDWA